MTYFAPYIDETGYHAPAFGDIQNNLISLAQSIFGSDIYLDGDSQDMQYIGAISAAIDDAMQLCQLAYNNQSPQTAIGTALDNLVALNGLERQPSDPTDAYSTCLLTVTGVAGTIISNGVAQDASGNNWDLVASSVIPSGGVLSVLATCETAGAITAGIGTITTIANPQYGWTSVSNAVAATPGTAIETDAELKTRQADSVMMPSQSMVASMTAAIQAVDGVTRAYVYENNTAATDSNSVTAHSVAPVVEGGADGDVSSAMIVSRGMGCGTYGSTTNNSMEFSRPIYDTVAVDITVTQLAGYSSAIQAQLISNVQSYINTLSLGASVQASALYYPALMAMANLGTPSFSINSVTVNKNGGTFGTSAAVAWNEAAQSGAVTITGGL